VRRKKTVFTAKTGTGASSVVPRNKLMGGKAPQPVMAKMTLTYGTTITIALQGRDGVGGAWTNIVEATYTTGSPKYLKASGGAAIRYLQFRLNISVNTGVTVDTGEIGVGSEDT